MKLRAAFTAGGICLGDILIPHGETLDIQGQDGPAVVMKVAGDWWCYFGPWDGKPRPRWRLPATSFIGREACFVSHVAVECSCPSSETHFCARHEYMERSERDR